MLSDINNNPLSNEMLESNDWSKEYLDKDDSFKKVTPVKVVIDKKGENYDDWFKVYLDNDNTIKKFPTKKVLVAKKGITTAKVRPKKTTGIDDSPTLKNNMSVKNVYVKSGQKRVTTNSEHLF